MVAFAVSSIACAWGMRLWLKGLNKKLQESEDETTALYAY